LKTLVERKAKLKEVMKDINKTMGFSLIKMGDEEKPKEKLSWGISELDSFTGGIVKGNFNIIYGSQSVGKSTLAYHLVASTQKAGLACCYIDMERSFSVERAVQFGVDLENLILITSAETAEQAMDAVIKLTREEVIDLIIIDSIQAMSAEGEQVTKQGKERSISDDTMALLARKLSQFFRICASSVYKANCAVLMIGQVRKELGSFIVRDGLSGGCALQHWAVMIMHMRQGQGADAPVEKVKTEYEDTDGKIHKETKEVKLGHDTVFKIEKTKVSGGKPEGSDIHIPFYFKTGFIETPVAVTPVAVEEKKNKRKKKAL